MKKDIENEMEDELLAEYDFAQMKGGVKGKYVEQYRAGTNLVLLDPDIAQAFPNDAAVNDALRMLIKIAQRQQSNTAVQRSHEGSQL
ncbi:hypothetical protein QUB36_29215 [Microcoleus sp. AT8-B1]|uniref:hypothetical protein n=1 Tax=unclassified Microcoleus TaxID=2642155 RepID=UPI002FCE7CA1